MKEKFIEGIKITHVYQERISLHRIHIYFKLCNTKYSLEVTLDNGGLFKPWVIFHESDQPCPFCFKTKKKFACQVLKNQVNTLFEHLIQFPSIRLEWLFIPYE